jgi:ABC-type transport system involved in multi-copper enzyme maturation permease subunit
MRLLGPVFRYDLVRVARRQPLAFWRAGYGLVQLATLFVLYVTALPHAWLGGHVSDRDAATLAVAVFKVYIAVQFAAVLLLTPALAANSLAEERAQNTLTFLLTTHLTNREIVLGKLSTRLLVVGMLVATGLPILALAQFLGGVEPNLAIAGFLALAVTALSLGGVGLACGVFVRKPQTAAWRAYQCVVAYLALSFLSIWYFELPDGPRKAAIALAQQRAWLASQAITTSGWPIPVPTIPTPVPTVTDRLLDWLNAANPYYAYRRVEDLQNLGDSLDQALGQVLAEYAAIHGGLAVSLGGLAVLRLRARAAQQSPGITFKRAAALRPAPHPRIKDRPVLWKELYCEVKARQRWLALFFTRWFYFASFFVSFFVIVASASNSGTLMAGTLFLLRYVGTFVVGLLCLRVALHAARSIGGERDRQTLDSLLTTQLTPAEVIRDKWWGSFLAGRWVFLWLLIHWGLGTIPFALNPILVPVLVLETCVYAAFAASLGLYCAARFSTTKQALAVTLLVGLAGTTLVPWAGGKFATAVLSGDWLVASSRFDRGPYGYPRLWVPPWPEILSLGLTPPRVLATTVAPANAFYQYSWSDDIGVPAENLMVAITFGLTVYAAAAYLLARAARWQFCRHLPDQVMRRGRPARRRSLGHSDTLDRSLSGSPAA